MTQAKIERQSANSSLAAGSHRWLRFSLRGALLVFTLITLWIGWKANVAHQQRRALACLQEMGGSARFNWEFDADGRFIFDRSQSEPQPPGPAWLRRWIGDEYFQEVWSIQIAGKNGQVAGLAPLRGLPHVRYLVISAPAVCDEELAFLEAMPLLEDVRIRHTTITGAGLADMPGSCMTTLIVDQTNFSDAGAASLARLKQLEYLNLGHTNITDAGLAHLAGLKNLEVLWLNDTAVSDAGLIHLAGLTSLQYLFLHDTEVAGSGLRHFTALRNLTDLKLDRCPITKEGLAQLSSLPALEGLVLNGAAINDEDLAMLPELPQLTRLQLSNTQIKGPGLAHLAQCPDLRCLYLMKAPVSDEGARHLARLESLEELYLDETAITDAGAEHLARLPRLRILRIDGTVITDVGAQALVQLPSLQYLDLSRTAVSASFFAGLDHQKSRQVNGP